MKYFLSMLVASVMIGTSLTATAEIWEDYDLSQEVTELTVIAVKPNYVDGYLTRLEGTWVNSMQVLKDQGAIKNFAVWAANVADSPNVFLTVTYENMGAMQQNAEQYQKMVAEMTKRFESNEEENQEISQGYEEYREIVDRKVLSRVQYKQCRFDITGVRKGALNAPFLLPSERASRLVMSSGREQAPEGEPSLVGPNKKPCVYFTTV